MPCHSAAAGHCGGKHDLPERGQAGRATFLACCRQGVFFIPLILILPRTFGLVGVEICQPIADALTFIVSLPFLLAFLKQLDRMDDAEKAKAQS